MIVEIVREDEKATFRVGELVELNRALFDGDFGYILLVTKSHPSESLFEGTVVQVDDDIKVDFPLGYNLSGYSKDKFIKFRGTLKLTQG
jgi:hypothetical protein